jgi:hypothetical protein
MTLEQAARDAAAIKELISAFESAHTRDGVFALAWAAIRTRMECETMMVAAYDPQEGLMRCVYHNSTHRRVSPSVFPPRPLDADGQGTQSLVIRSGSALLFEDFRSQFATAAPRFVVDYVGQLREVGPAPSPEDEEVPPCAIMVPFGMDGGRTGVLQVFSTNTDAYTAAELVFLDLLGEAVEAAIARVKGH